MRSRGIILAIILILIISIIEQNIGACAASLVFFNLKNSYKLKNSQKSCYLSDFRLFSFSPKR